jgi:DNA-binding NarL/FixJ family response regulator
MHLNSEDGNGKENRHSLPSSFGVFQGRRIVLVDDSRGVMEAFEHLLGDVTTGEARFVHHIDQSAEELCREILQHRPDLVLLDANLARGIKGYRLLPLLLKGDPQLKCLGFSSDDGLRERFREAGAVGFVHKRAGEAFESLREVVDVMGSL